RTERRPRSPVGGVGHGGPGRARASRPPWRSGRGAGGRGARGPLFARRSRRGKRVGAARDELPATDVRAQRVAAADSGADGWRRRRDPERAGPAHAAHVEPVMGQVVYFQDGSAGTVILVQGDQVVVKIGPQKNKLVKDWRE